MTGKSQEAAGAQGLPAYRAQVLQRHAEAFRLHAEVAAAVETEITTPRPHPTHVHLVLDMLLLQGVKSHVSVSLLCQHGLMEDAATATRRLLEMSVQAVYIGQEGDERLRRRRAGQFTAYLWRQLTPGQKRILPPAIRARWTSLGRGYGRFIPRSIGWGPSFRQMFKDIGHLDLWETDYSLLSSIAHGTADTQVFQFSSRNVRVHDDRFASVLLTYASRYLLVITDPWRSVFERPLPDSWEGLRERITGRVPSPAD